MDEELAQALEAARTVRFDALASSAERARLAACLGALEGFDLRRARIPSQMAFWINVFNAAVLRDAPELGPTSTARAVQAFFEKPRLKIGPHAYSLDDVEHGVLRGNAPKQGSRRRPMKPGDPRLEHVPILLDERVHFALYSACRSSPPLRVYEGGRLDSQLEDAATDHVRRTVRVQDRGAVLVLPQFFRWFADDFGGKSGILEFVAARLADEAAIEMIDRRLGDVSLRYEEFDWTLERT